MSPWKSHTSLTANCVENASTKLTIEKVKIKSSMWNQKTSYNKVQINWDKYIHWLSWDTEHIKM